jgi:hypothetical protein
MFHVLIRVPIDAGSPYVCNCAVEQPAMSYTDCRRLPWTALLRVGPRGSPVLYLLTPSTARLPQININGHSRSSSPHRYLSEESEELSARVHQWTLSESLHGRAILFSFLVNIPPPLEWSFLVIFVLHSKAPRIL